MFNTSLSCRNSCSRGFLTSIAGVILAGFELLTADIDAAPEPRAAVGSFIENHCLDCHDETASKGGLDLEKVPFDLADPEWRTQWIHIFDRLKRKEMPPDADDLPDDKRQRLLWVLEAELHNADMAEVLENGRGSLRRLTRGEYESNLRDLLHLPQLDIRDRLPEDRTALGFSKAASTLDMSRIQLNAYLDAAEHGLRQAIASGTTPVTPNQYRAIGTDLYSKLSEHGGREAMFFAKRGKMLPVSNSDFEAIQKSPQRNELLELALFRSATWPYYGYPRGFVAKHNGAYRLRISARAVRQLQNFWLVPASKPLPMTFRARQPSKADVSGDVRATGGILDIEPESKVYETTILLKAGETFEYSLLGLPVPHPITSHGGPLHYNFPPMSDKGHRGVVIEWLEVEGPVKPDRWPPRSHRVLFGDLPIRRAPIGSRLPIDVVSQNPKSDSERLLAAFARNAARGPVSEADLQPFLGLIHDRLGDGTPFAEAMLTGYQAFLCSGHFLYLPDPEGQAIDAQHAIASRLSHFLWDSRPDAALQRKAAAGQLHDPNTLSAEVDRLIADDRFLQFVRQFTDEWLDLDELRRDLPDIRLYPEYRKDDYLVESMEQETRAFFATMVRDNLPITTLVDCDFVFANDRLARHYGLPAVAGSTLRQIPLPEWSPYGGLLTQASIMKITANGTTTSPVLHGAWIMKNLIGDPPPNPPTTVPAVEPDIRGATTIRDILARHTESESCASCHARFDPVGLALENFDIMGAWRDRYRGLEHGDPITGIDRAGHAYEYRVAHPVDSSGRLRTGETFKDIHDLKKIFASRPRPLARNLLHQFTVYATGTPVRFSDRREIVAILDECQPKGFRVKDLLKGLVGSRIFGANL